MLYSEMKEKIERINDLRKEMIEIERIIRNECAIITFRSSDNDAGKSETVGVHVQWRDEFVKGIRAHCQAMISVRQSEIDEIEKS